jgi:hypothetical protein
MAIVSQAELQLSINGRLVLRSTNDIYLTRAFASAGIAGAATTFCKAVL